LRKVFKKALLSRRKKALKKKKLILLVKKRRNSVIVSKTNENFPAGQSSSKIEENIEKKRNKEGTEDETEGKKGNKEKNLDAMVSKKKKWNFQKFHSSERKSVKFSPKIKVTLFFLLLF
jgi:hypothetical protein